MLPLSSSNVIVVRKHRRWHDMQGAHQRPVRAFRPHVFSVSSSQARSPMTLMQPWHQSAFGRLAEDAGVDGGSGAATGTSAAGADSSETDTSFLNWTHMEIIEHKIDLNCTICKNLEVLHDSNKVLVEDT